MALLANLALKFQKSTTVIGPKNFLLSKFELGYQKYAEFRVDSKTVEKNAINLLAKKLQTKIVERVECLSSFIVVSQKFLANNFFWVHFF